MIARGELRRQAAQAGVGVELQERDYALGWFLLGLARTPGFCETVIFKGGTALRKTYFPTYRFSEDLDFTLAQPISKGDLRAGVEATCQQVQRMSGVRMWMALWRQTRDVVGQEAYRIGVAYTGPLGGRRSDPPRIQLDLTRYERVVLSPIERHVFHPYSDAPSGIHHILTYRLEEMMAEKLRALLRRCYPRDLYDVWYLLKHHTEHLNRPVLRRTLEEKCRYKGLAFSSASDFLRLAEREGMAEAWSTSLQRLAFSPPPYETVMAELETILPEWLEQSD